jgi:protein-L-isoaspartate(D-aspartate) O-methyltransferase
VDQTLLYALLLVTTAAAAIWMMGGEGEKEVSRYMSIDVVPECGPPNITEDMGFTEARERMVGQQLASRDITDAKVLAVIGRTPRQMFMPENVWGRAYHDGPQPIGYGQTISQPYIVALMTQELKLNGTDRVLEVGTGSGYQAAVLAGLVDEVCSVEIIPELAERANKTLQGLGYCNVKVRNADGYYGWGQHAPYDAIIITAAVDHVPPPLIEQLADGGRLILPLGSVKYYQTLTVIEKEDGVLKTRHVTDVRFVPMTGQALKG